MKPSRLTLLLVLLLATFLSACQDDKDKEDSNDNNAGRTAALPLTQTFTKGDPASMLLTIKYPENWVFDEPQWIVATSPAALEAAKTNSPDLASGEAFFQVILQPTSFHDLMITTTSIMEDFRLMQAEMAPTPQAGETAEPLADIGANEAITIDGMPGFKASFTSGDGQLEGAYYAVQYNELTLIAFIGAAHSGEWENYAATAEAVIAAYEIEMNMPTEAATEAP